MFDISDRVVIVTGASGGIGSAIAAHFLQLGARTILVSRSGALGEVAGIVKNAQNAPLVLSADISIESDVDAIVETSTQKWGRIDALVNCAGTNIRKRLDEYTRTDWDQILDLNLKAVFFLTSKVATVMKRQSYGRIVNIGSIQGSICWSPGGKYSLAPYCASKAGLISLTKSFALDLAPYNITVNAICPGVVEGKWAAGLITDPQIRADALARTPMKRFATHSDLLGPALFFSTDASSFVTGQALLVDGGWTIE